MSMFWDAIDRVSLPNTLGMSQYGDGGLIGTKPYVATGNYINKMSNYADTVAMTRTRRSATTRAHSPRCTGSFLRVTRTAFPRTSG